MAQGKPKPRPDDAVEAAIACVLEAEAVARAAVARAHAGAAEIAELARETARRLGLHTDDRIGAVRAAFTAKIAAEVAALEAQAAALGAAPELTAGELARVAHAVAALGGEMTGERW
ncbi:MAG: hypothetical protein ABI624_09505 [Casimicrobiaceae bacterium]